MKNSNARSAKRNAARSLPPATAPPRACQRLNCHRRTPPALPPTFVRQDLPLHRFFLFRQYQPKAARYRRRLGSTRKRRPNHPRVPPPPRPPPDPPTKPAPYRPPLGSTRTHPPNHPRVPPPPRRHPEPPVSLAVAPGRLRGRGERSWGAGCEAPLSWGAKSLPRAWLGCVRDKSRAKVGHGQGATPRWPECRVLDIGWR